MFPFLLISLLFTRVIKSEIQIQNSIASAPATVAKWNLPVLYTTSLDAPRQLLLTEAIQWFEKNSCIRFKKRNETSDKGPYLNIYTDESDKPPKWYNHFCGSQLGVVTESDQPLKIDCALTTWMVVREIAHSLGLVYEHNRMDRDSFVVIRPKYIMPEHLGDYEEFSEANPSFPYDLSSVMHMGPFYRHYALNVPPMYPRNDWFYYSLGSARIQGNDVFGINQYYQCLSKCANILKPACKNGGQQDPNDCSGCVCPPMFTGKFCGQKHPGIQPFNGVSCGETIIAKNITQTHAFYMKTKNNSRDSECYFFIEKTDSNMRIEVNLNYYYQSVENDKKLRICESGVQIYNEEPFTNNAMTVCDQTHLVSPRNFVQSKSKIVVRIYNSNLKESGSVDMVIGFTYRQH